MGALRVASAGNTRADVPAELQIERRRRQMTWHLQNESHAANEQRIRRLMRLMRLMPIYQTQEERDPAFSGVSWPSCPAPVRASFDATIAGDPDHDLDRDNEGHHRDGRGGRA